MLEPDYSMLRDETKFSWNAGSAYTALLEITGIPINEFYLNPKAGIELYRKGRPMLRDMFGPDVQLPALHTPWISYGHINGLGARLSFPDLGEVNYSKICETLESGIKILKKDIDFATSGMAPFYLDYQEKIGAAFNGEKCGLGYSVEGPITTAYMLRGDRFFYDPYDNPELLKEFLRLEVESIIDFVKFRSKLAGAECPSPNGWGLADDISSMLSPAMWPEFVIPFIEQYFRGLTTGRRHAHIEDLREWHMPFLEDIKLFSYDPSISPKINPKIIFKECRVAFSWRLGNFHYHDLSCEDIQDWVFQAVADGASSVFTYVGSTMCNEKTIKKVHSFIQAAKKAEDLLKKGTSRRGIGKFVSKNGRKRFWDNWP